MTTARIVREYHGGDWWDREIYELSDDRPGYHPDVADDLTTRVIRMAGEARRDERALMTDMTDDDGDPQ